MTTAVGAAFIYCQGGVGECYLPVENLMRGRVGEEARRN